MASEEEIFWDEEDAYPAHKGELFTPLSPELLAEFEEIKEALGGTWAEFCRRTGISRRYMRHVRNGRWSKRNYARGTAGRHKTISMRKLDQIYTQVGLTHRLRHHAWFTTRELVELDIWKEMGEPFRKLVEERRRSQQKDG